MSRDPRFAANDFVPLATLHRATMLLSLAQPVAVDLAIQFKRSPFASAGPGKEKDDLLKYAVCIAIQAFERRAVCCSF